MARRACAAHLMVRDAIIYLDDCKLVLMFFNDHLTIVTLWVTEPAYV
jgi:hypothetical protein